MTKIQHLHNPDAAAIGLGAEDFLQKLTTPVCLHLEGEDSSRTRALVTLIHGNEPSGFIALHRWLQSGRRPAVNILCLIPSVAAAQKAPLFSHRVLPGGRDLNRCFSSPFTGGEGELAAEILETLETSRPEAVVDMHNTSGSGPGFGVAISADHKHQALISLFASEMVTNDLRLGALMEIAEHLVPTVTIECGGRLDEDAHTLAWQGLQTYFTKKDIFEEPDNDNKLKVYINPVRLEIKKDCQLSYADKPQAGFDLTLKPDIERFNYRMKGWTEIREFNFWFRNQENPDFEIQVLTDHFLVQNFGKNFEKSTKKVQKNEEFTSTVSHRRADSHRQKFIN